MLVWLKLLSPHDSLTGEASGLVSGTPRYLSPGGAEVGSQGRKPLVRGNVSLEAPEVPDWNDSR